MTKLAAEEKKRRALGKRPTSGVEQLGGDSKRPKLESDPTQTAFLSSFDFSTLPATLITDLIVANLEAFSLQDLVAKTDLYRQLVAATPSASQPAPAPPALVPVSTPVAQPPPIQAPQPTPVAMLPPAEEEPPPPPVKKEAVYPLQMEIGDEEMEFDMDKLNSELAKRAPAVEEEEEEEPAVSDLSNNLSLIDFKAPSAKELSDEARLTLMKNTASRIWNEAEDEEAAVDVTTEASDMWMLVLVRMITRVAEPPSMLEEETEENKVNRYEKQDRLRQTMCDYIMADFPRRYVCDWNGRLFTKRICRLRLATTWMNEEWYNDRIRSDKDRNWVSLSFPVVLSCADLHFSV
jgi:symplekin